MEKAVLEIQDLTVSIGARRVIDNVSLSLEHGKVVSLVGESGSGKTLTALATLDLLPGTAVREKGKVLYKGQDIFDLAHEDLRRIRGKDIAMVFQEPFTALNPVMRAGIQINEAIAAHTDLSGKEIIGRTRELLEMVKLSPEMALRYPHELSGGMRQRIVLAMALSCGPEVLILDEPTTALDVSVQKQMLDLVKDIQRQRDLSILFITHDFSIVNTIADEVCVMKQGGLVEKGEREDILQRPQHPYTKQLIECIPRLGDERERLPA
ncbi:ABC transporter ATP-binding protein [Candidatus Omnitrophota bacterium]